MSNKEELKEEILIGKRSELDQRKKRKRKRLFLKQNKIATG